MTEKSQGGVEILVHISAPSTGKDDAHYRAQASAFILFEPVNRLSLCDDLQDDELSYSARDPDRQLRADLLSSISEETSPNPRNPAVLDDKEASNKPSQSNHQIFRAKSHETLLFEKDFIAKSPQMSFDGAQDNLDSPPLLRRSPKYHTQLKKYATQSKIVNNESSWSSDQSFIADSQPLLIQGSPKFSSPTRILQVYRENFRSAISLPATAASSDEKTLIRDSFGRDPAESPKPTPLSSLDARDPLKIKLFSSPVDQGRGPDLATRNGRFLLPGTAPVPSTRSTRSATTSDCHHISMIELPRNPPGSRPTNRPSPSPSPKRRKLNLLSNPPIFSPSPPHQPRPQNEHHPPSPRTAASHTFSPPLTPSLHHLSNQLALDTRYVPLSQLRPLRVLERGFWSVATASWDVGVRHRMWTGLGKFVRAGKGGWGLWGMRYEKDSGAGGEWEVEKKRGLENEKGKAKGMVRWERGAEAKKTGKETGNENENESENEMEVRVYCWGGVVAEVWGLLYLASEGRVKGAGARWIDGGGEVIIFMA